MIFVDKLLSFRQDVHSPSINKFRLYFDHNFDTSRVNGWISTVLRHKVEEIVLKTRIGITFPPYLFTCESLTMLEIDKNYLELPELVNFPKLRILRLCFILKNEHFIQKLFSNSPVLEELSLQLRNNYWDTQHLSIFGPRLKRLFINISKCRNFHLKINAPNLQSFTYSRVLANDFVLPDFSTLLDAAIILAPPAVHNKREELRHLGVKLFASLSNLKRLTISDYGLKLLSYHDHFRTNLPSFYKLTHLELMSADTYFENGCYYTSNLKCRIVGTLLDFLHILPNLESLVFAEGFCNYESYYYWSLDLIPQCLLLHLKSIEFRGVFWAGFEKNLVRLFLKNAKILQRVSITISGQSDLSKESNYKKEVQDEISLFPRGSADCVFHVS